MTRQVYVTAIKDMRSRMIVGFVCRPFADTETILAALKIAFREHGKCLIIRPDWGKDWQSALRPKEKFRKFNGARIATILDTLGVSVQPVTKYSPYCKPIESFFRTMHARCDKMHLSYWGGNEAMRHEDRQAWLERNMEKAPTLKEYERALQLTIETFHQTPHSAVDLFGKSPLEAMAAFRAGPVRRESDGVLDHYFQRFTKPYVVGRDGIRRNGVLYGNDDPRLIPLQGETVVLAVHPDDGSRLTVCQFNDDRTPLFDVECLSVRGLTDRQLRDRKKRHREMTQPFRALCNDAKREFRNQTGMEHVEDLARGIALTHGRRDGGDQEAAPASIAIRPQLTLAIENKGDAPSDAVDSKSVRTGTDDTSITLDDLLDSDDGADDHRLANSQPTLVNIDDFYGTDEVDDA